jgi:hypothetical protein
MGSPSCCEAVGPGGNGLAMAELWPWRARPGYDVRAMFWSSRRPGKARGRCGDVRVRACCAKQGRRLRPWASLVGSPRGGGQRARDGGQGLGEAHLRWLGKKGGEAVAR